MRDFLALKGLLAMAALFTVAMLALWVLVDQGQADLLVPTPQGTAEQFLRAVKAHRFEAARDLLSQEAADGVDETQLREMARSIERSRGGLRNVWGREARRQGDSATATVAVVLGDQSEVDLAVPLRREQGVWKVASLEPLRGLSGTVHRRAPMGLQPLYRGG